MVEHERESEEQILPHRMAASTDFVYSDISFPFVTLVSFRRSLVVVLGQTENDHQMH
jgi:hypothetical protein